MTSPPRQDGLYIQYRGSLSAGATGLCTADGKLPAGTRLLRMARDRAAAVLNRRQAVLGRILKIGRRDVRRLLITGAMSVVRWVVRQGASPG